MRRVHLLILTTVFSALISNAAGQTEDPYAAHVSRAAPRTPEDERKGFHLPPGFDIELVAAEPNVRKPINIQFDDRNRLWVTESKEYPFPAPPGKGRDTLRILEASHGAALANKVTTFTADLNIPIGVLPISRGAIVYSIPNIYRLTDTQGKDRADKKEVLYGPYGYKDTHGMTGEFTWGFDGWVYACHGFSNTSTIKGRDGSTIVMESGNVYRFKPDGSRVEQITHGQVNPFGLAFDPLGNLYSCDCHSRPIYQLLRGAYYPSFGKPHDGLDFGPEMLTHDHGSTAIAGITYYAADHFPLAYRDTIFIGNVVTNRINHDKLERHGSTYKAIEQPDFLSSDDPWFRPVDIKLGPDGALYVADFYNRIIGHYEVPLTHPGRDHERGRLWRIVYRGLDGKGKPTTPRADWAKASVDELVADLAHPNLTVRVKATNQLVERGGDPAEHAVKRLWQDQSQPFQRMHGLWVLERLGKLNDKIILAAAGDKAAGVRVHVLRILAERKTLSPGLQALAVEHLGDKDAFARRAAAEVLGRHPREENIAPLLDLRQRIPAEDTHLLHVARMALRDQLVAEVAWSRLRIADLSEKDARALADVATGVPAAPAASYLLAYLERYTEKEPNQIRYVYHVARYGQGKAQRLLAFASAKPTGLKNQLESLKAFWEGTQARGDTLSGPARVWGEKVVRQLLASKEDDLFAKGMEWVANLRVESSQGELEKLVVNGATSESKREMALAALASLNFSRALPILSRVMDSTGESLAFRVKAATLLADNTSPASTEALSKTLAIAPEKLALVIAAGLANQKDGANKLLAAVSAGKASPQLLQDRRVETRLLKSGLADVKKRMESLTKGLPSPDQRFMDLLKSRREGFNAAKGNVLAGAKVFEKHCAACHQIANKGAKIGPQLDGVGIRGLDRLLEDILDPSRNVDQAFRLTSLGLANGRVVSGLLLREEGQVLVLADAQGKEVRVEKAKVEDRTLSQLSPMPANLVDQIPEQDFYHLLTYLLVQQPPKTSAKPHANAPGG